MATAAPKQPPTKPRKDRERETKEKGKSSHSQAQISPANERLKTIVRRLPPNLPEEIFWQSVQSWVTENTATWKMYYPGKASKRLNKENTPSRAYIAFKNEDQLTTFSREYDGHIFRDKAGNEFQAVVEFAPYQKIPSDRRKVDARNATIEKDEDYISFIEALNASKVKSEPVSLETLIASTQPPPAPTTTPLLEALKAEKSAAKDREAILRNHPHYKEIASKKEDGKKKGASNQAPKQEPPTALAAESSSGGKKGKRGGGQKQGGLPPNPSAQAKPVAVQPKPGPSGASAITSPSKPPRGPKNRDRGKQQALAEPSAAASTPPVAIEKPSPTAPTAGPSQPSLTNSVAQPPTAPRRMRLGIASRQFEAALSGVGVSRRRDKEEKADSPGGEGPKDGAESIGAGQAKEEDTRAAVQGPIPVAPRSAKRDRRRKESGGVDTVNVPGPNAGNTPAEIRVPGILQRIDGPQAPPVVPINNLNARIDAAPPPPNFGHPGRGGPRGRGRGRGRGGPPRASG